MQSFMRLPNRWAGAFKRFTKVTLPMLSPTIFLCLVMQLIGSFQVFDTIMAMTQAAPDGYQCTDLLYISEGFCGLAFWICFCGCICIIRDNSCADTDTVCWTEKVGQLLGGQNNEEKQVVSKNIIIILLILVAFIMMVPFIWMVLGSVR